MSETHTTAHIPDEAAQAIRRQAFNAGYVLACCNIVNLHDEPVIAYDTLSELGVSRDEITAMNLSEYDLDALNKIECTRTESPYSTTIQALYAEPAQHPDDTAVDNFARLMKTKLARKREEGRSGWQDMSADDLTAILRQHVDKGDPVDVANLCMMLSGNGQRITPAAPTAEAGK